MINQIINKDDLIKFKNDIKIYCVVSFDLEQDNVYVSNINGVIASEKNDKDDSKIKFKISDINKIIFKESQQKKIDFPQTKEDILKSIDLQLKNISLPLSEIKKLKQKRKKYLKVFN